jgi:hypothetical protein
MSHHLLKHLFGSRSMLGILLAFAATCAHPVAKEPQRHAVSEEYPRLLGSLEELRALARSKPGEYRRLASVARGDADEYSTMISMALVAAIEGDEALAAQAQQRAMKYVNGPIRAGHVPFATDLALCGLVYDLCRDTWPEADRRKFHEYLNRILADSVGGGIFINGREQELGGF